jgi:hypothetical protein
MRCLTCNASRYKTNDDNANDGSMDNNDRKRRGGGRRRKTLVEIIRMKGKTMSMKEKFWPS